MSPLKKGTSEAEGFCVSRFGFFACACAYAYACAFPSLPHCNYQLSIINYNVSANFRLFVS